MRRFLLAPATAAFLALGTAGAALADSPAVPPGQTPPPGAYPYHVQLGNGECVDIDHVLFLRESRGLHQGASASGAAQGPEHRSCPA
jgi:hypothetical protein